MTVSAQTIQHFNVQIQHTYPHDPGAFTQGLFYSAGFFYESTGLYGRSSLRKVAIQTGEVLQQQALPQRVFAEGLAQVDDHLIQLTYREQEGRVYRKQDFKLLQTFTYSGEGWGLTYDGQDLIMSNGSANLIYLDTRDFKPHKTLPVTQCGQAVTQLNELEYINGYIYANIWHSKHIVQIDPATGYVLGVIDLTILFDYLREHNNIDVANGIAYDAVSQTIWLTGKFWPTVFAVTLQPTGKHMCKT